ncbi:MAG TPA: hypothetical protein PKC32_03160 [Sphingopyxis sp.]|nr:hypothetical protein [Sphingopyxis sp.]
MSLFVALTLLAAAPPPGEDADSIIVTATPGTEREKRKRAVEFVRRTGVAELRPIARWIDPVCPRAMEVDDAVAGIVEERVRAVAAAAGARVAAPGCTTNIVIVFAANGEGLARTMLEKSPQRFSELSPAARERAVDGDDAIRWWYSTRLQSRDAVSASTAPMPWIGGHSEGGGSPLRSTGAPMLSHTGSSLVGTQAVRALSAATVIIDVEKAHGYPLDAVAAFAAMVAMAEMDSDPPPPDDSILGLFDGEPGLRELSKQDTALLRAIFSVPPDREAHQHRRQLISAVRKEGE